MKSALKLGVVGAGVFGGYHAGKCAAQERAEFVGVHDPNPDRMAALVERHGGRAFASLDDLIVAVDALVIASPAVEHGDAAMRAIAAGRHVLIEKPLAHRIDLAEAVVELAQEQGVILQVGHQERFVVQAIGLDRIAERPSLIRSWRDTPYNVRGTDVSVALDLMTHDLDLILWLMGEEPDRVSGTAACVRSETPDTANVTLVFGGSEARLSASRVADTVRREMELTYPSGTVKVDFNAKTVVNGTTHRLNADFANMASARDSLGAGTDAFIAAILDGTPVPVTGGNGLRALRYALLATEGAEGEMS